jgi:hypothetical protein
VARIHLPQAMPAVERVMARLEVFREKEPPSHPGCVDSNLALGYAILLGLCINASAIDQIATQTVSRRRTNLTRQRSCDASREIHENNPSPNKNQQLQIGPRVAYSLEILELEGDKKR